MKTNIQSLLIALSLLICGLSASGQNTDYPGQPTRSTHVNEPAAQAVPAKGVDVPVSIRGAVGRLDGLMRVPEGKDSCAMVILCHGLTSSRNSKLICALADSLERAGIASVRFDYNGHGTSEGAFVDMTVVNEVEDTHHIYDYVRALPFVTDIALLGHSQGGLVAGLFAPWEGCTGIKCLVLMAPGGIIVDACREGKFLDAEFDPANPPRELTVWKRQFGLAYIKTAQNLPVWEEAAKYNGPTCIIHSTDDQTVPYEYAEKYHQAMPGSELHALPDNDHSFRKDRAAAVTIAVGFIKANINANEQ